VSDPSWQFPAAPPPSEPSAAGADDRPAPAALRPVIVLLLVNLGLSILLTVAVLVARHSVIEYQLDHRHIASPAARDAIRASYSAALVGRVIGNVVASIVYAFLLRALLRGRRWAYRRVIMLGGLGIVALGFLLASPYPVWMHAEQVLQALVLAGLLYFVLRPEVRSHFRRPAHP
jgi:hypothetical protein